MRALTEKDKLPELKRRISAALKNVQEAEIKADTIMINDGHTIHFTIQNKDYYFKGAITKRCEVRK